MRKMKDSGLGYLGEIPAEWSLRRLKTFFAVSSVKNRPDATVLSLYRDHGIVPKDSRNDNHNVTSLDTRNYKFVEVGDFVINKMKGWQGSMALSAYKGIVSPAYHVFKFTNKLLVPKYAHYLLRSRSYADEWHKLSTGLRIGQWDLHVEDFLATKIPLPVTDEQSRIADFLDAKCAEIDRATAAAEQSIKDYKAYKSSVIFQAVTKGLNPNVPMKDSGVEWMGDVPAHWRIVPGKRILSLLQRPVLKTDGVVTCFRDGEVTLRTNRRTDGFTVALKEIGYQGIEPGDLVVHSMDGFAGSIGISDSRGKASPVLNVMDSTQNKRYLMYYMRGLACRDVYMALSDGIRVRSCNLSWKKISNLKFVLPSRTEQSRIADFLDAKCAEIDRAVKAKQAIIDELKAYKQALIYETVTGKREV